MKYLIFTLFIGLIVLLFGFRKKNAGNIAVNNEVITSNVVRNEVQEENSVKLADSVGSRISNHPQEFVDYAKTLLGTPYLYGSTDPAKGLDCSGFINAVSKHFGIKVPRSSVEFTNIGTAIDTHHAQPGDLMLFTGTDPKKHVVGHIGIITDNQNGEVEFIHSSSGKAKGVTVSELEGYYQTRLVKVIRIFPAAIAREEV